MLGGWQVWAKHLQMRQSTKICLRFTTIIIDNNIGSDILFSDLRPWCELSRVY